MSKPLLTILSYSGGKQSSAILWMVILGIIEKPQNFVVLNADPGMENSGTYEYIKMMKTKMSENNIEFYIVDGPNLYEDLINLKETKKKRIDNPAYWTKNKETGSKGRLRQSCTYHYKIQPMDKIIRKILEERFNISKRRKRIGENIVEKWIGFTYSEIQRVKPSPRKYFYFKYPLIDMEMSNQDVLDFFEQYNLSIPPRSVCNACFANGLNTLKEMYHNRPNDWKQAIEIDESIRNMSQVGIRDEVYVSNTLYSLTELAKNNFFFDNDEKDLEEDYSCDSGYCFV